MNNENEIVCHVGQVISTEDSAHGGRIKVKLKQDYVNFNKSLDDEENSFLDAFPLLPKVFQSIPKEGESVFVFTREIGNDKSQRYYLGPIISQPQFMEKDLYPQSISLTKYKNLKYPPYQTIDEYKEKTSGAFPELEDIAVVGRKGEDIILKDDEIDLRCGIRTKDESGNPSLAGNVIFNTQNPSYLQLKYKSSGISNKPLQEAMSMVNIVADKINLISYKNEEDKNHGKPLAQNGKILTNEDMDNIMEKLHQLPYGDILCEYLEILKTAFLNHVHPYPGIRPCQSGTPAMEAAVKLDFNKTLSPNVRIS